MKTRLILGFAVAMSIPTAYGDTIGIAVNGACEAGSCPPTALALNSSESLPFNFTVTLADGDEYLIGGSFTGTDTGDGFSANHVFQVTYEGNATGGPSAADSITVDTYYTFETTADGDVTYRDVVGAFGPTIAPSSSASSCVNGTLGCVGPLTPPRSFDLDTSSFTLNSSNGSFVWDPRYTNNFGAGSAVGSYIVWGQTGPPPGPSVPEPASFVLVALGLCGTVMGRRSRRPPGA